MKDFQTIHVFFFKFGEFHSEPQTKKTHTFSEKRTNAVVMSKGIVMARDLTVESRSGNSVSPADVVINGWKKGWLHDKFMLKLYEHPS